jgi:S-formylglutathione hydrolase FrmB
MEAGLRNHVVQEFILVVADYSSPTTGSIYENSNATGRWLDFTVNELVPFIDTNFHTLRHRDSRALVGEMMGGRGAFMLGMKYPETFGIVYAMNPVGTATGILPIQAYPNWRKMLLAKSFNDFDNDHISQLFITMSQAFLSNPNRPPFYCDFLMEMENNEPTFNPTNAQKHITAFLLSYQLDLYADNLRKLKGIAFDWARYDQIQDHVSGSVALSRKLETYGIAHEAEEYRGVYWEENWKENGRFYARVLPFLNRHLVFDSTK